MNSDAQRDIATEIEAAMEEVLSGLGSDSTFSTRFRQLVRNAINNNLADSDIRSVIDAAPSDYPEGE
jgi:hypothetical protein